jgi:hypothetical protein
MFRALLVASLLAVTASAETPQSVIRLVPVVGSVVGANDVRWRTDVELRNDTRQEVFVVLKLPTAPDQPAIAFTLPPGGTQRFTDVVGEAFGMDSALSPLIVETMGKLSVLVSASVYGVRSDRITRPEPIPVSYIDASFAQRTLHGLLFSDLFRTNIGLVNLGEHEATFVLALQRLAGRNIAVSRMTIPSNSLSHTSIQSIFPLITKGDDFSLVIESSAPSTYVYGSVIENATSEARFITPAISSQVTRTAVFSSSHE